MTAHIDQTVFNNLQEATGEVFNEILETYLIDTETRISLLEDNAQKLSQTEVVEISHSIKGSSKNVGANSLAALCEQLEMLAREAIPNDLNTLIEDIRKIFLETHQEIAQYLESS